MSTRKDEVQVTVLIDGKQGINELGKLEMEASDLKKSMVGVKEETDEYVKKSKELAKVGREYEKVQEQVKRLAKEEPYNIAAHQKALAKLAATEEKYQELGQEIKNVKRYNDEFIEGKAKLAQVGAQIEEMRTKMGAAGMTMNQLRNYQRQLNNELNNLTYGTQKYTEVEKALQSVNGQIDKQRNHLKGLGGLWGSVKNEVKAFGILAAGYLGVEFLSAQVSNIIRGNAKLSDSLADIRKTTGMTKEEVQGLNSELSKVNTRTGTSELRDMAIVAGQIGIAKEEILEFVKATDKAVVALGDEFMGGAEQVAKEIGSLQRLFKDAKNMNAGEAISRIGSALNELGAAGSATAPAVAEFAKRIGPLGNLAPQIAQTLGLGAAFEELGLTAEISSGGLTNILLIASKEVEKFSKFLDMPLQKFRQLINESPNDALLVMAQRFKGLENDQVVQVMQKLGINSQEATKVMSLLAEKTDFVREKQELAAQAMSDNISLQEENNVKQETFGGLIDRIGKKLNGFVNNQGFVEFLTSAATNAYRFLVFMKELPTFIENNKTAIKGLAVSIGALIIAYLAFNTQKRVAMADSIILNALILKEAAAKQFAMLSTINLTMAQRGLNTAMKANPIGFVIGIIMLLVGAFAALYTNSQTVRGAVSGVWEALKTLVVNIKDNVINVFSGLGDVIMGVFNLDEEQIKRGLTKAIKGAFNLSPVGLAMDSGKKMASAFVQGYNDRISEEAKAGLKGMWGVQAPKPTSDPLGMGWKPKTPKPVAPEPPKVDPMSKDQVKDFLKDDKDSKKKEKEHLKAVRDKLKQQEEYERQYIDIKNSLIKNQYDRERAVLETEFSRKMADLRKNGQQESKLAVVLKEKLEADLAKVETNRQAAKEAQEREFADVRVSMIENQYDREKASLEAAFERKKADLLKNGQEEYGLVMLHKQKLDADLDKVEKERLKKLADDQKLEQEIQNRAEKAGADLDVLEAKDKPDDLLKAQISKIELLRDIELQNTELTENEKLLIKKKAEEEINNVREENLKSAAQAVVAYFQQASDFIMEFSRIDTQKQLTREEDLKDQKLKKLDQELKVRKVSTKKYAEDKEKIELQYEEKSRALKNDQAKKEKQAKLLNAVMSGAAAVVEALPNIPLSIVTGVMAGINIATIAATPVPQFAEGGSTTGSISAGGYLKQKGPFLATFNEQGEEYVVPNYLLRDPVVADFVSIIESKRSGNYYGKAFQEGGSTTGQVMPKQLPATGAGSSDIGTAVLAEAINRLNFNLENPRPAQAILDHDYLEERNEERQKIKKSAAGMAA